MRTTDSIDLLYGAAFDDCFALHGLEQDLMLVLQVQWNPLHDCSHHPCSFTDHCHDCDWEGISRSSCKSFSYPVKV